MLFHAKVVPAKIRCLPFGNFMEFQVSIYRQQKMIFLPKLFVVGIETEKYKKNRNIESRKL
ncbi:MAG: hypothetical protein ACI81W_004133 [Saprospiraceae bacterium]